MSKLTLIAVVLNLCALAHAQVILPQTSSEQNRYLALKQGEAAYADNGDGTVSIYLGYNDGKPALAAPINFKPTYSQEATTDQYVVKHPSTIKQDPVGTYTYVKNKDVVGARMTIESIYPIGHISYERIAAGGGGMTPSDLAVKIDYSLNRKIATLTFSEGYDGVNGLKDIRVGVLTQPIYNRFDTANYYFIDSFGQTSLNTLRSDMLNTTLKGRLAKSWANYPAVAPIDLAGHAVYLQGQAIDTTITSTPTSVVTTIYGHRVLSLAAVPDAAHGNPITMIRVSAIEIGDTQVVIRTTLPTTADVSQVVIKQSKDLSSWSAVGADVSVVDKCYTFTVPKPASPQAFWRVTCPLTPAATSVEVHGALILSSPNGTRFKVSVSDAGTLTATKVSD